MAELRALDLEVGFDSESYPDKGKMIIDAEPNAIVATTKCQASETEEPEEGECIFHSQMWVKGDSLHFVVDRGIQKNLISAEVIKWLNLPRTPHPHP